MSRTWGHVTRVGKVSELCPIFWDMTSCSLIEVRRYFDWKYSCHLQCRRSKYKASYSSTMKLEAVCYYEMSVNYQNTRSRTHLREYLGSHTWVKIVSLWYCVRHAVTLHWTTFIFSQETFCPPALNSVFLAATKKCCSIHFFRIRENFRINPLFVLPSLEPSRTSLSNSYPEAPCDLLPPLPAPLPS